jgi:hypothetical protein
MIFHDDRNEYELTSGRRFRAHAGFISIGIGYVLEEDTIGGGWDDDIPGTYIERTDDEEQPFTLDERREIADEMIRRWTAWGAAQGGPHGPED